MPRKLKIAAIQMDATPAPVTDRLARAADLIAEAVSSGAQLVVLPEVFNTGYEYSDQNYSLPEPMDGQTITWMKKQASQHNIHLAGSLLLLDHDEVYNAALLIAPDGRTWRYDKNYPWAWERTYFREGQGITVADTDLGKFGMMICWDYAHPELWARYAGKVDAMVVTSCPPAVDSLEMAYPDGTRVNLTTRKDSYTGPDEPFGSDMDAQAAWLRVPMVNTTGAGNFRTKLPMQRISFATALSRFPGTWQHILNAPKATTDIGFYRQTKVVDAQGQVLARVKDDGDGFTIAEVELADVPPQPLQDQPKSAMTPLSFFFSDWLAPALTSTLYRRGLRRQYGTHMAPVDYRTKMWTTVVIAAGVLGWLMGRIRK